MKDRYAWVLRAMGEACHKLDGSGELTLAGGKRVVAAQEVRALCAEGLCAQTGGSLRRTAAGRAYLRRVLAAAADEPFASQHRVMERKIVNCGAEAVTVDANAATSSLALLANRKDRSGVPLINDTQRKAGERLAADHERGHRMPQITARWDPSGVKGEARRDGLTTSEAALDARHRVADALASVGPGLSDVLVEVCCDGMGLEAVEKRHAWPARSGKVVLRLALDRLAVHYGLASQAVGGVSRQILQWGTADYRPTA